MRRFLLRFLAAILLTLILSSCGEKTTESEPIPPANWVLVESGISKDLHGVICIDTLCIAVGAGGTILTSPDGITWHTQTSNTNCGLNDVAWSGKLFLAVGDSGITVSSPDGVTWAVRRNLPEIAVLSNVIWADNIFVVAGNTSRSYGPGNISDNYGKSIWTSIDGMIWNEQLEGITNQPINAVTKSDTLLVGVGEYTTIVTSVDGLDWTLRSTETSFVSLYDVVRTDSLFVAVGMLTTIRVSADGISWHGVSAGTPVSREKPMLNEGDPYSLSPRDASIMSVAWSGDSLVAVGTRSLILSSSDGIIWHKCQQERIGNLYGVAWYETTAQFIAVGWFGRIFVSD